MSVFKVHPLDDLKIMVISTPESIFSNRDDQGRYSEQSVLMLMKATVYNEIV